VKKHATAWIKGLIKYGIGLGMLAWVIYRYWDDNPETGAPGLHKLIQGPIEFGWLILAVALLAVTFVFQTIRWYVLVRALDLPFSMWNTFRLGLVGAFCNQFLPLPGAVGGDFVKSYFIARAHPERMTRAVATVLTDRALGMFGLILFIAVLGSVFWALGDPRITANVGLQTLIEWMALISGASIAGFLLLGLLPQRRVDIFANRLRSIPKVGKPLAELWYAVWMYRQRLKAVTLGLFLSAASHFAMVLAFHCASQVFPASNPETDQATLIEHLVVAPIGFIVQALPISPGGVGVGEAAFAGLYKLCGRPESRGVIGRLSFRVGEWIIALLGGIIYLRMRSHHELPEDDENGSEGEKPPDPSPPVA
jgi:glycosyltransferase 2 family protein